MSPTIDPQTTADELGAIDPALPEAELFEAVAQVFDRVPVARRRELFVELDEKPGRYRGYPSGTPEHPEWHWKLRRTRNGAPPEVFDRILGNVPAEIPAPAPSAPTRPPGFGPPRAQYALAEVGDRVTYDVWHDGRVIGTTTFIVAKVDTRQWEDQFRQWVEDADGLERGIGFYDSSVIIEPPT